MREITQFRPTRTNEAGKAIMDPPVRAACQTVTVKEFVRRALGGDRYCEPIGDHLAFSIEIHSLSTWWYDTSVNPGLRQWILMRLLEGEAKARKDMCTTLLGKGMSDLVNPKVFWDKVQDSFLYGCNRCTVCMDDLGQNNPRQLCGKTFCYNCPS